MLIIFGFSARPGSELPDFGWADVLVKKGGHMAGYAMLALAYLFAFRMQTRWRWACWLLALGYAVTDELHQSFVPGRTAAALDVLVFDNFGALISLWVFGGRRDTG